MESVRKLHEKGIVLYDMRDDNMMYEEGNHYFIDFADAVYENNLLRSFFARLKKKETEKMTSEIKNCVNRYYEIQEKGEVIE